jgi:hypothetical protein
MVTFCFCCFPDRDDRLIESVVVQHLQDAKDMVLVLEASCVLVRGWSDLAFARAANRLPFPQLDFASTICIPCLCLSTQAS